jgi:hypothetical protein
MCVPGGLYKRPPADPEMSWEDDYDGPTVYCFVVALKKEGEAND